MKKFTKHISPILFGMALYLCLTPALLTAQEYEGYSAELIESLNTAKNIDYLTDEEKEVILMINMIRHDGTKFWNSQAEPYIKSSEISPSRYTRSLEKDLKASSGLTILQPNKTLFEAARKHAVASGKEGQLGHTSSAGTFEQRLRPLTGEFNYLLENSDYGSSEAIDIIMNLMIDEGIPDVGHRKNIMNDKIDVVGVAIAPHKTYYHTCVQIFGQKR